MGFRSPMDYNSINHQIHVAGVELNSPYNDGFTTWEIKKNLYQLKWLIDGILERSGSYAGEKEFLEENGK
jgi:hypothetical protein